MFKTIDRQWLNNIHRCPYIAYDKRHWITCTERCYAQDSRTLTINRYRLQAF